MSPEFLDTHAINGLIDVIEFNLVSESRLQQSGWRGSWSFMGESLCALTITPEVQTLLNTHRIEFLSSGERNYRQKNS